MSAPPTSAVAPERAPPVDRVAALPTRFGRYLLVEHLGSGGMADVFRAVAPGAAGVSKAVCIKRIRDARLREPRLVSLFIDEARISVQLSHPNIVHTYDFGRVGDEYFLALELVEGVDLGVLIDASADRGDPLTPEEIAAVGEAVCRALAHVHARKDDAGRPLGLVHRDVTPANVLLTREGDVKLTDFGVARLRDNVDEGLRGTLTYMAPEQAHRTRVDARTDLFGLGLVLFECLRGKPAYSGSRDALLAQARRGIVELSRTGDEPPLEAALLEVIERATRRAPPERYSTAALMAEDLGRIVAQARAAGAPDPRASLAHRVAARARSGTQAEVGAAIGTDDPRAQVSYTLDGDAPDFAVRLGATELSQAATVDGLGEASPSPRPRARGRLVAAAAGAGVLLGLGLALVWPARGVAPERPGHAAAARAAARSRPARPGPAAPGPVVDTSRPAPAPEHPHEDAPPAPPVAPLGEGHGATAVDVRPAPPRAPATLDLNAIPWAEVSVDGVSRGTTPVRGIVLPAGRHRLRLTNGPLGADRTMTVTLRPGDHRTLVVNLREDGTDVAPTQGGNP